MVSVVRALKVLVKEIGRPPALAIIDTWSRTLGGDDSAPSDAAAGVAALDALRTRFGNFATLVVHHEGHQKGRGRGWSGLRAAVDVEFRAERGKDELLRLECTKSKDTRPIDPMAFQFAGVELGIMDEEGNPFTSAVLNTVGWTPALEVTAKKPAGKNQAMALDILKQFEGKIITVKAWHEACKAAGMERSASWHAIDSLKKSGMIQVDGENVRCKGVTLCVENRGLLYSPPVSTHVSTLTPPVENTTVSTPFNDFNGQPDIPDGISPEEYRECYDTAYSTFIDKGLSPDEADRKAREEIRKFIAGYDLFVSRAVVSSPIIPDEGVDL
jgi:hypothetical protein